MKRDEETGMTRCEEVESLLAIHAVEETDVGEALRVEQHVDTCAVCREALRAYGTIRETVRRDLRDVPEAPALQLAGRGGARRTARVWAPRLAAAALLLAAGLLLGRWSAPAPGPGVPVLAPREVVAAATGRERALALSVFSPAARPYLEKAARPGPGGGAASRPATAP